MQNRAPLSVSRIGGQAGPRLPTLRPHPAKAGEAGPEALSTSSLPITRGVAAVSAVDVRARRLPRSAFAVPESQPSSWH